MRKYWLEIFGKLKVQVQKFPKWPFKFSCSCDRWQHFSIVIKIANYVGVLMQIPIYFSK